MSLVDGHSAERGRAAGFARHCEICAQPAASANGSSRSTARGCPWSGVEHPATKFPGVTLKPFFTMIDAAKLESIEHRAIAAGIAPPRLASYFAIVVPRGMEATEVATEVSTWPRVELAYVEGRPGPPPAVNAADDPLSANRCYCLLPPPASMRILPGLKLMEAGSASSISNKDGSSTTRTSPHPSRLSAGSAHPDPMWVNHGTSVLGIVAGVDNDKGIVGIAPHTSVRVVSQWFEPAGQEPVRNRNCARSGHGGNPKGRHSAD